MIMIGGHISVSSVSLLLDLIITSLLDSMLDISISMLLAGAAPSLLLDPVSVSLLSPGFNDHT